MAPRPQFSTEDSIKIVAWWYELKDIHKVRWRYAKEKKIEAHPRELPSRKVFKCVIERFRRTGSVKMEDPVKEKPVTTEENIEKVRRLVEGNIGMSLRQMSVELGLAKSTVWKILRKSLNFYPYRIHLTTELTDQRKKVRLDYDKWLLEQLCHLDG